MPTQHANSLGGIYGVQSAIGPVDNQNCDEIGGLLLHCPLDSHTADDENADDDVFYLPEGQDVHEDPPEHAEDAVADAAYTAQKTEVFVVFDIDTAVLFVVECHEKTEGYCCAQDQCQPNYFF